MNIEEITLKISEILTNLESSGDIMITTSTPNTVIDSFVAALKENVRDSLNDAEFNAVTNSLNVLTHDIKLDSRNFQTIIGISKYDLEIVLDKLLKCQGVLNVHKQALLIAKVIPDKALVDVNKIK